MTIRLHQVDAFTTAPFRGNPAAVCLLDRPAPDAWMQAVAAEMNLSETAFVSRRAGGDGFDLRWFTPATEVDLCGHATLATAHTLWECGDLAPAESARFHTRSGWLTATRADRTTWMDFPALESEPSDIPGGLAAALGAAPVAAYRNRHDLLVELPSAAAVRALDPDIAGVAAVDRRAVVVTALADDDACDFVSRCFAPRVGVPEDPVTGSAHCALAPFWGARLGRDDLVGAQLSSRGGIVQVRVRGDRVHLGGAAVTVLRGELLSPPH